MQTRYWLSAVRGTCSGLERTDTHPDDSRTVGLCVLTLTLTSCLLFSEPKQLSFPPVSSYADFKTLPTLLSLSPLQKEDEQTLIPSDS